MQLPSDDKRLLALQTNLDADVLLVNRFTATERISRLFRYDLDVMSPLPLASKVKSAQLLGTAARVRIITPGGELRFFHGIISRIQEGHEDTQHRYYRIELSPWLWRLTLGTDCRTFQEKNVPEIVTDIFREQGELDFIDMTTQSYPRWDYCVQYRETHFNFISRLLEQEGITYFFQHDQEKHILVLADRLPSDLDAGQQPAKLRFDPDTRHGVGQFVMNAWERAHLLTPGNYRTRDYHFAMPDKTLEFSQPALHDEGGNKKFEVYDYPGEYIQQFQEKPRFGEVEQEGARVARVRMEEEESCRHMFTGTSPCQLLRVGSRFDLSNHPTLAGGFVPIALQHTVEQVGSHFHNDAVLHPYVCSVTAIEVGAKFRPPRATLRPVMQGPQTAKVVGPEGTEIFTDEFGRIKVHFHWDRRRTDLGVWVRVAQIWAGRQWGAQFIPRVGQEVLVDFLEGDPDQPIVVGSVYNGTHRFPFTLADKKTQSGIRTRSTPDGDHTNFNEIRFEDQKGSEQLYMHAERNMDVTVEANRTMSVGGNQVEQVEKIKANAVTKSRVEDVIEHFFLHVGGDRHEQMLGDYVADIGGQLHLLAGSGGVVIESTTQITLQVGGNFINIGPAGIAIQGTAVLINSGGAAGVGLPLKSPSMYGPELEPFDGFNLEPPPPPDLGPAPSPNPLPPPPPPFPEPLPPPRPPAPGSNL